MVDSCITVFLSYLIQKAERYIEYPTTSIVGERSHQYFFQGELLGEYLYNVELWERVSIISGYP